MIPPLYHGRFDLMSFRFACAVVLLIASFAGLYALGRGRWNMQLEQRHALSRVLPPEYYDDYVRPTVGVPAVCVPSQPS